MGFKQAPMVEPIRQKHVRRRLRVIKTAAQPGPSCWRNSYLARIGEVRGGVAALARWSTLWAKGNITEDVAELWTAAIVVPVDCGQAKVGPDEAPRRKLRPIACAEAPLKLAEGVLIDGMLPELARVLEPRQVGCGMADGAGIVVSLVRSWAADIVSTDRTDHADPETILGVDLANAYGKAYTGALACGARGAACLSLPLWWRPSGRPAPHPCGNAQTRAGGGPPRAEEDGRAAA